MTSPEFAIFYNADDAYSTAGKIMGRQSAGKGFLRGVAQTWPQGVVRATGRSGASGRALVKQLRGEGFEGRVKWSSLPDWTAVTEAGSLYYPAPIHRDLAAARNQAHPAAFSLIGVTHTLSSLSAMDSLADLVLPPFRPWDALICTSTAAQTFAQRLHDDVRCWWREHTGATRFNTPQLPVIPLGVDAAAFASAAGARQVARAQLELTDAHTAFLFAGRLSFHAKANPAPVYQALEKVAKHTPVVCIEAGLFENNGIRDAFFAAQRALAPSVRFIWVPGRDAEAYRQAWEAADVFVSLADNIQETFGLTPLEAMAAGLPVVVSDWNGYKDTVRNGIDGYRVPTVMPTAGCGQELVLRHGLEVDRYDYYIGRASLATVVEPAALEHALKRLALDAGLRLAMGAQGRRRAQEVFDWPLILPRYNELAQALAGLRADGQAQRPEVMPQRADPFSRFAHYPSDTLARGAAFRAGPGASTRLQELLGLAMANYALHDTLLPADGLRQLLEAFDRPSACTITDVIAQSGFADPMAQRLIAWLWKFDLIEPLAS